jgi:hypothetical protein
LASQLKQVTKLFENLFVIRNRKKCNAVRPGGCP